MSHSVLPHESRTRPLALAALAATGVLAGGVLGATTNAVNGAVSPTYFVKIMRWEGVADVWRASVAQGCFEGLLFGVLFSLVFTTSIGIISGAACPYREGAGSLLGVVAGVYACWALGGLAAIGLALLSPTFYRSAFLGVPEEPGPMLRYAWVGGSIWGAQLGALVSVVLALVVFRSSWRARAALRPDDPRGAS